MVSTMFLPSRGRNYYVNNKYTMVRARAMAKGWTGGDKVEGVGGGGSSTATAVTPAVGIAQRRWQQHGSRVAVAVSVVAGQRQ